MPTLIQINTIVNSGSTGRITEEIGQIAIKTGWKSYIAYGRGNSQSKSTLIKIGNKFDIIWHGLLTLFGDRHGLGSQYATIKLIKIIKQIKPDIIHLHNIHGYYLNYKILFDFLSKADIPIIWTLHDCWAFTGHCACFDAVRCNKWKSICDNCVQKRAYPKSIFDNSKNNFKLKRYYFTSIINKLTIIPVSYWLNSLVTNSFLSQAKTQVIHNGINLNIYKPSPYEKLQNKLNLKNKFCILGVANGWGEGRRLYDFIKLSKVIDNDTNIILVGLSSKQIQSLPHNIIGLKRTENQQQLVQLYSMVDVFVNVTYEDNFPTVNIESLACGTPVITYNTGGSVEAIDSKTGIVVEKGNVEALSIAIEKIRSKGKKYYMNDCIERAKTLFSKDDRFREYIELYKSLVSKEK